MNCVLRDAFLWDNGTDGTDFSMGLAENGCEMTKWVRRYDQLVVFSICSMCVFFMPENGTEWDSGTDLGQRILRNCPVKKWLSYGIILYYGTVGQIILYLYI